MKCPVCGRELNHSGGTTVCPCGNTAITTTKRMPDMNEAQIPNGNHAHATEATELPFQALHNFVLIEPIEQKLASGLALPDGVTPGDLKQGIIRSIGEGHHTEQGAWVPTNLKPGQTVYLTFPDKAQFGVVKIQINGRDYLLVHEGDIAGIKPETAA